MSATALLRERVSNEMHFAAPNAGIDAHGSKRIRGRCDALVDSIRVSRADTLGIDR
jgi:hypothetical protein